jgi:cytochrome P450
MTPAEHAERRKIWDRAFTPSALKLYEPLLDARVTELVEQLSARVDTEIDIAEWLRYARGHRRILCANN